MVGRPLPGLLPPRQALIQRPAGEGDAAALREIGAVSGGPKLLCSMATLRPRAAGEGGAMVKRARAALGRSMGRDRYGSLAGSGTRKQWVRARTPDRRRVVPGGAFGTGNGPMTGRTRSGKKNSQTLEPGYFPESPGRPCWARTSDQRIKSPLLYQLS